MKLMSKEILDRYTLNNGEMILNAIFPNDFELYLIALEIRDDDKVDEESIVDLLVFPVNPESVMKNKKVLTNIKKSFSGVHVNINNTFVPSPLNLSGTFGRSLKFIVTGKSSVRLKTGFGVLKYLDSICDLSRSTNENGKPYRTILHFLPMSESLTVEIMDVKYNMTMEKNRLWYYDLTLIAVAPGNISFPEFNARRLGINVIEVGQRLMKKGLSFINKNININ